MMSNHHITKLKNGKGNMDLISRQAVIDTMDNCYWSIIGDEPPKLDEKTALYVDLKQAVKRLPTVEPKKGRWIICSDGYYPYCSECNYRPHEMTDYCPNCGAKMKE